MALNKPSITEKVHYSSPSSGGSSYSPSHGGGNGYSYSGNSGHGYGGSTGHVYSSIGHTGHSGYEHYEVPHHSSSKGGKRSIALSALTLLAFLFLLHILSTCLEEQIEYNTTTNVVVVAARSDNDVFRRPKGEIEDIDEYYIDEMNGKKKNNMRNTRKGKDEQKKNSRTKT